VFDARARAYRLYLAREDHAAARVAVWLASCGRDDYRSVPPAD
jgi:hypothetical protein